jgi:Ca2+-binding EF-hand superfamily protein
VRQHLAIEEGVLSQRELAQLFRAVDADGSGAVDATEFAGWLFDRRRRPPRAAAAAPRPATNAAYAEYMAEVRRRFRQASAAMSEDLGWGALFRRYDDDGSGELELEEFQRAMREECGLDEAAVSADEVGDRARAHPPSPHCP